ncbi:hypothetical protein JX266_003321 [Neoarthrinium moseri]|nr:hypothetical protein JX266_003321 [Neoarthrinium moseri]
MLDKYIFDGNVPEDKKYDPWHSHLIRDGTGIAGYQPTDADALEQSIASGESQKTKAGGFVRPHEHVGDDETVVDAPSADFTSAEPFVADGDAWHEEAPEESADEPELPEDTPAQQLFNICVLWFGGLGFARLTAYCMLAERRWSVEDPPWLTWSMLSEFMEFWFLITFWVRLFVVFFPDREVSVEREPHPEPWDGR